MDAAISGLKGQEAAALSGLLASKTEANQTLDPIAMLAGAATKAGDKTAVQQILAAAADTTRAEPQRLALLRGLDAGLERGGPEYGRYRRGDGRGRGRWSGRTGNAGGFGGRGRGGQAGGARLCSRRSRRR